MQFCRDYFCKPCSAAVTSPQEDMEYRMGSCIGVARNQVTPPSLNMQQMMWWRKKHRERYERVMEYGRMLVIVTVQDRAGYKWWWCLSWGVFVLE
ncbi:uncharacterized protein tacc2 isoform X1 [Tachysurus ichikawai]